MARNRAEAYQERAIFHETRVRNYRRQAELLLERDADTDCAGALLYEAAKQCINAVANQRRRNPGTTGGKFGALREIAESDRDGRDLMRGWQHADKLHVNSDRGHLPADEFTASWDATQTFINAMLRIYASSN